MAGRVEQLITHLLILKHCRRGGEKGRNTLRDTVCGVFGHFFHWFRGLIQIKGLFSFFSVNLNFSFL